MSKDIIVNSKIQAALTELAHANNLYEVPKLMAEVLDNEDRIFQAYELPEDMYLWPLELQERLAAPHKDVGKSFKRIVGIEGRKFFVPNKEEEGWIPRNSDGTPKLNSVTLTCTGHRNVTFEIDGRPANTAASKLPYMDTRTDFNPFLGKRLFIYNVDVVYDKDEFDNPIDIAKYLWEEVDKKVGAGTFRRLQKVIGERVTFQCASITFDEIIKKLNVYNTKGFDKIMKKILSATYWKQSHTGIIRGSAELADNEIMYDDSHVDGQLQLSLTFARRMFGFAAKIGQEVHLASFINGPFTKGNGTVVPYILNREGLPTNKCVRIQGRHFCQKWQVQLKKPVNIVAGYCYDTTDEASMPTSSMGTIMNGVIEAINKSLLLNIEDLESKEGVQLLNALAIDANVAYQYQKLLDEVGVSANDISRKELNVLALGIAQNRMDKKFQDLEDPDDILDLNGQKIKFTLKGSWKRYIKVVFKHDIGGFISQDDWDFLNTPTGQDLLVPAVVSINGKQVFVSSEFVNSYLWYKFDGFDGDDTIELPTRKVVDENHCIVSGFRIPTPLEGVVNMLVRHNGAKAVVEYPMLTAKHPSPLRHAKLGEMVVMEGMLASKHEERHLKRCANPGIPLTAEELREALVRETAKGLNQDNFGRYFNFHKQAQYIIESYKVEDQKVIDIALRSPSEVLDKMVKNEVSETERELYESEIKTILNGVKAGQFRFARFDAWRKLACLGIWKHSWDGKVEEEGQDPRVVQRQEMEKKTFVDSLFIQNIELQKTIKEFKERMNAKLINAATDLQQDQRIKDFKVCDAFQSFWILVNRWYGESAGFQELVQTQEVRDYYGNPANWTEANGPYAFQKAYSLFAERKNEVISNRRSLLKAGMIPKTAMPEFGYHSFILSLQRFDREKADVFRLLVRSDDLDNCIAGMMLNHIGRLKSLVTIKGNGDLSKIEAWRKKAQIKGLDYAHCRVSGWDHLTVVKIAVEEAKYPLSPKAKSLVYGVLNA